MTVRLVPIDASVAAGLRPGQRIRHRDGDERTLRERKRGADSFPLPGWWLVERGGLADRALTSGDWSLVVPESDELAEECPNCAGRGLVSWSGRGSDGPEPCPACTPPMPYAPGISDPKPSPPRLRVGRKVRAHVYIQVGDEPSDDDRPWLTLVDHDGVPGARWAEWMVDAFDALRREAT